MRRAEKSQWRRFLLAALAASLSSAPAKAETASPPPIKDWSIETVVVTAKKPGPALRHIVKGNAEVWILATIEPAPKDLAWDSHAFRQVLAGANQLLLPPRGQVGVFEGLWFLIMNGDVLRLPDGSHLEQVLPAGLKGRFVALRTSLHRDEDRYAEYKPSIAGFLVESDFINAAHLTGREPVATVESLADRASVPVKRVATYAALQVVEDVPKLSTEANLSCFTDALDDIDILTKHAQPAARAWADGDLETLKAHYSEPKALDCLSQSASFNKLWERSVNDTVGAVDTALKRPGKTVLVIEFGELLRKNGILDRLRAEGLTVEGPGD
jgi:uncharacterized protein YbaP (TraB family)